MADSIDIPGFRITRKLGQGGMASVYLAIQESFGREVALKVMSPFLNCDPSFASRFLREARIVAQIHHASIVPVIDVGQHEGLHYLSMEYLPGGDLKQRIVADGPDVNLALNVCVAISSALDLAHRKGFVHRDIKPENVLFREDGTPVLTDFGIARAIDAGSQQLTMAGTMIGTPSYMSPEQVKGVELDGRSDLYSLGVVFYEMLTGLVPFRADSTMSLAMKHLNEPLPLLPLQFAAYQPFLDRLMAKEREDRFASGAEVIRALRLSNDMSSSHEHTQLRHRTVQAAHTAEVLTLVASNSGSMAATSGQSLSDTFPIPSISTQPTASMQVPSAQERQLPRSEPTASEAEPAEELATTLVAPSAVVRQAGEAATAAIPAAAALTLRRASKLLLQRIAGSKHATWGVAVIALALLTSVTVYLVSSGTGSSRSVAQATSQPTRDPTTARRMVAVTSLPRTVPPSAAANQDSSELASAAANDEPPVMASPSATAGTPADAAAAQQRVERDNERRARIAERIAAQKQLAAEQVATTEQAQRRREVRIRELLLQAKADIAQGNLVSPENANAWARYREVQSKEPGPAEAQEVRDGLRRIAEVLVLEAQRAIATGNRVTAGQLIDSLRLVQVDHPELGRLQTQLQDTQPAQRLTRMQQNNLMRYLDHVDVALNRIPPTLGTIKDALKHYDNAQRVSNVASGLALRRVRIEEVFVAAIRTEIGQGNTKQAREIIAIARARNWLTADLSQVEKAMDATQSP